MNRLLKGLSPKWQYIIHEYARGLIAALVLIALAAWFVVWVRSDPHKHVGYEHMPVMSTFDVTTDDRYAVRAIVRAPDGNLFTVRAKTFSEAQWFTQDVCIQILRSEKGKVRYRLKPPRYCAN